MDIPVISDISVFQYEVASFNNKVTFSFDRAYNKLVFKRLWSKDYGELLSIVMLIGPETTMNDVQFQIDTN